jgi:protein gp37
MAQTSKIQWTDATWNVARGCTKVDEDCKYCYMYRESFEGTRYDPKDIVRTKTVFNLPLKLKEPSKIFTSSLTDFFHEAIDSYRNEAWDIIRKCPQHTFQILTKRPERIEKCLPDDWGNGWPNVWLGTSVGSNKAAHTRIVHLVRVPAIIHFISFEPLWEEIDLNIDMPDLMSIDWAIIGGESGNENGKYKYRPCELKWIEYLIKHMKFYGAAVFVKQLGTYLSKQMGLIDRHGGDIDEWPEHLKIREFPITRYEQEKTTRDIR